MKKIIFMSIILTTYSLTSCGPTSEDALDYYENIISYQKEVIEMEEALQNEILEFLENPNEQSPSDSLEPESYDDLDNAYTSFLNQIKTSITDIASFPDFVEDSTLKKASLNLLNIFKSVADNEYSECINLIKLPDDEFLEEHNIKFNKIFSNEINKKLDNAIDEFGRAQQVFADKYSFEIVD